MVSIRILATQCSGTSNLLSVTLNEFDLGNCASDDWPVIACFSSCVCCFDLSADAGQLRFHLVDLQPQGD